MKSIMFKDIRRRLRFSKIENKYVIFKAIINTFTLDKELRIEAHRYIMKSLKNNDRRIRIKNRCIFTNRGKSIYRKFGISRIKFREFASQGLIPGVRKSSW